MLVDFQCEGRVFPFHFITGTFKILIILAMLLTLTTATGKIEGTFLSLSLRKQGQGGNLFQEAKCEGQITRWLKKKNLMT